MALNDPYVTSAALKTYLNITNEGDDSLLAAAALSASRQIEQHCGRQFNQTTTASARVFTPSSLYAVEVDDFHTTTDLVVKTDTADDGAFATTITSTDYELWPRNGIESGLSGFPYRQVRLVESYTFPTCNRRAASVQITAQWGWTAVPDPVKQSCYILAAQLFGLKNATLGVAGFNEFGVVRVRDIPQVAALLAPYRHPRNTALVA